MAFSIYEIEASFAFGASAVPSSASTAIFSRLEVDITETVRLERISEIADFAAGFGEVLMAAFDVTRLDADVEWIGDLALLAAER